VIDVCGNDYDENLRLFVSGSNEAFRCSVTTDMIILPATNWAMTR